MIGCREPVGMPMGMPMGMPVGMPVSPWACPWLVSANRVSVCVCIESLIKNGVLSQPNSEPSSVCVRLHVSH